MWRRSWKRKGSRFAASRARSLCHPVRNLTITISSTALTESHALKTEAKTLTHLNLTVITTNTTAKHATIHLQTKSLAG